MKKMSIKEMPVSERPYERFETKGPESLTDAELLSIIIKSGNKELTGIDLARKLLSANDVTPGLRGLGTLTLKQLTNISGVGRVKAIQILAIFELAKRLSKERLDYKEPLNNPSRIAEIYSESMASLHEEHMLLLLLDNKLRLIKEILLSKGTVNSTLIQPRELFIHALKNEAVYFIVIHNHPSGDPSPSKEDIEVTKRLKISGDLIGIIMLDHLIIGQSDYRSLKKLGFLN